MMIETARHWWKFWSVRFDAIMYAVMGYFIAYPAEVEKLVGALPESIRPVVAFVVPILLFAAKTGARVTVQPKLTS